MSQLSREKLCEAPSHKLAVAQSKLSSTKALVGLDGFVDEIIAVVDKRQSNEQFEAIRTIEQLGSKIRNASGQSSNYELVVKQMKLGGNGPIMANALVNIGFDVTYVGNLGYPNLHPVFEEFSKHAHVV